MVTPTSTKVAARCILSCAIITNGRGSDAVLSNISLSSLLPSLKSYFFRLLCCFNATMIVYGCLLLLQHSCRVGVHPVFLNVSSYTSPVFCANFPSAHCPPANGTNPSSHFHITVAVLAGSTALDVMQGAIDINRRCWFQATSFGAMLAFSINAIEMQAQTIASGFCSFSIQVHDLLLNVGVSCLPTCIWHEMSIQVQPIVKWKEEIRKVLPVENDQ